MWTKCQRESEKLNIDGNSLKRKLALKRCGQLWSLQLIFQEVPFCVLWKWNFQKKYRNYQTNEFIWQLHIGDFFFHVKIKIIDDFSDEFLICKWQVYKIIFLTSWTWTKNGVFELQMYNVQITQSNISVMYHNFHLWTPHQISFTMIKQLHV